MALFLGSRITSKPTRGIRPPWVRDDTSTEGKSPHVPTGTPAPPTASGCPAAWPGVRATSWGAHPALPLPALPWIHFPTQAPAHRAGRCGARMEEEVYLGAPGTAAPGWSQAPSVGWWGAGLAGRRSHLHYLMWLLHPFFIWAHTVECKPSVGCVV